MTAQSFVVETTADGDVLIRIPQQRTIARHAELLISAYLAEKGMPTEMIRRKNTTFGKLLRTEYVKEHGREPHYKERWIGGKNRPVASYTSADRPLFDRVYRLLP